ncbi:MULE domain-containing protein [Aphis craccivora]|uniref:MULE domain-containing protein n=1 Tax=Aphis craccivora TaxID=307492 RepID=A0A6G0YZ26_APHCR|nr:MULE domain-containing protein [Aphis craccivora]
MVISNNIVGCRFHLIQSWYQKIQELGLTLEYKKKLLVKTYFGLTFLDPLEVSDCFSFDLMLDIPDDKKYSKYADYILENYIDENSKFPPSMWTSYSVTLNRTTNNCESFLSHFNQIFYKAHPSFFAFLQILKDTIQTDEF